MSRRDLLSIQDFNSGPAAIGKDSSSSARVRARRGWPGDSRKRVISSVAAAATTTEPGTFRKRNRTEVADAAEVDESELSEELDDTRAAAEAPAVEQRSPGITGKIVWANVFRSPLSSNILES